MIGHTVGHYRILERLGGGGMGVVYKAEDTKLGRSVALKFLPPELTRDDEARTRFLHEARAAAHLDHPNICTVYDIGEADDDRVWIAMACYEGETLRRVIDEKKLSVDEAIRIVFQLARGLSKAHSSGIVHRDIKPANVMITSDGIVKILDFGLAKLEGASQITGTGRALGTAMYMSPEQLRGESVGPQADIWALGVVMFELLTGQRPFRGEYEQAVVYSILNEQPSSLSSVRPDVPPELDRIVARALSRDPRDRYQAIDEVIAELGEFAGGRNGTGRLAGAVRRIGRRVSVRSALVALLVLVAAAGLLAVASRRETPSAPPTLSVTLPASPQLAVVPFQDLSEQPLAPMLGVGLAEAISAKLGGVSGLQVVATTTGELADERNASEITRRSGTNLVLRGTLQRFGESMRVTWTIVDARGRQLAGATADAPTGALFSLQDAVSGQILEGLRRPANALPTTAPADPALAQDRYLQALGYLAAYDREASVDSAIEILETLGDGPQAQAALCRACLYKYRLGGRQPEFAERAQQACRTAAAASKNDPEVHLTLGQLYLALSKLDPAAVELERAIALRPDDPDTQLAWADLCDKQNREEEAEAAYKAAVALRPGYWGGHNQLATYYVRRHRREEALSAFQAADRLGGDNILVITNLGATYQWMGRYEEALGAYERALRIRPNGPAYANRGTALYYLGRFDEAVDDFERATALDPHYFQMWVGLADALRWSTTGKSKAPDIYRKAVERGEAELAVRARDPLLLAMLATCHAKLGNKEKAVQLAELAVETAPDDSSVSFVAGVAMEVSGKRQSAVKLIGHALEHGYTREEVLRDPELKALVSETKLMTGKQGGA